MSNGVSFTYYTYRLKGRTEQKTIHRSIHQGKEQDVKTTIATDGTDRSEATAKEVKWKETVRI